jgi:hypothetical protein
MITAIAFCSRLGTAKTVGILLTKSAFVVVVVEDLIRASIYLHLSCAKGTR